MWLWSCTASTVQHWQCFCDRRRLCRLNTTQIHWGPRPEPKSKIKTFSEWGVEGVEVDQWVRGDSVEGQSASRTVHIHCYSTRKGEGGGRRGWGGGRGRGGGSGDECLSVVVTGIVTTIKAPQTPGLIIHSKLTVSTVTSPFDSSVTHWYRNIFSPLDLPVTATSQTSSAQQLRTPVLKPLCMIRIWLILLHTCHLPVVVRQFDLSVDCVCVDCELTGIWWREKDATQLQLLTYQCDDDITDVMWLMSQCFECFFLSQIKTHSHFLRPGVNHRSPAGSTLKRGGGSEQYILSQDANMDMTWLSYTETQHVHQACFSLFSLNLFRAFLNLTCTVCLLFLLCFCCFVTITIYLYNLYIKKLKTKWSLSRLQIFPSSLVTLGFKLGCLFSWTEPLNLNWTEANKAHLLPLNHLQSRYRISYWLSVTEAVLFIPESVQSPAWILQSRQQLHSWVSWMIVAQVQLSQMGGVGVQSWGQIRTAFLCDQTAWQTVKTQHILHLRVLII